MTLHHSPEKKKPWGFHPQDFWFINPRVPTPIEVESPVPLGTPTSVQLLHQLPQPLPPRIAEGSMARSVWAGGAAALEGIACRANQGIHQLEMAILWSRWNIAMGNWLKLPISNVICRIEMVILHCDVESAEGKSPPDHNLLLLNPIESRHSWWWNPIKSPCLMVKSPFFLRFPADWHPKNKGVSVGFFHRATLPEDVLALGQGQEGFYVGEAELLGSVKALWLWNL